MTDETMNINDNTTEESMDPADTVLKLKEQMATMHSDEDYKNLNNKYNKLVQDIAFGGTYLGKDKKTEAEERQAIEDIIKRNDSTPFLGTYQRICDFIDVMEYSKEHDERWAAYNSKGKVTQNMKDMAEDTMEVLRYVRDNCNGSDATAASMLSDCLIDTGIVIDEN